MANNYQGCSRQTISGGLPSLEGSASAETERVPSLPDCVMVCMQVNKFIRPFTDWCKNNIRGCDCFVHFEADCALSFYDHTWRSAAYLIPAPRRSYLLCLLCHYIDCGRITVRTFTMLLTAHTEGPLRLFDVHPPSSSSSSRPARRIARCSVSHI